MENHLRVYGLECRGAVFSSTAGNSRPAVTEPSFVFSFFAYTKIDVGSYSTRDKNGSALT